jgi:beta-glucosidase
VLYPFGFGLSYTTFKINPEVTVKNGKIIVKAVVTNTGAYSGKEVVQVYFSAPQGRLGRPARELAGFKKTKLLKPARARNTDRFLQNQGHGFLRRQRRYRA